jgi:hypothetical protein
MMTKKNLLILVGVVVLVLAGGAFGFWDGSPGDREDMAERKLGDHFNIASAAEILPRFVEAEIDPLKVSIGDVQKMKVVLEDDVSIVSVVAEIETDNGTITVPLRPMERRSLTQADLDARKYLVEHNRLVIVSDVEIAAKQFLHSFIPSAAATERELFTYEGEWQVHDTSVREYTTVFVATDEKKRENRLTMAWSDPCTPTIPLGGGWTVGANCSLTGPGMITTGVDNGGMSFGGAYTITLSNSAIESTTFVWNSGQTISINNGGQFSIGSLGKLLQTNLWVHDADADNYARYCTSSGCETEAAQDTAPGSTYRRRYLMQNTNAIDCLDTNNTVYPGAGPYPDAANGGDHNCDSSAVKGFEYLMYSSGYDIDCIIYFPESYACGTFVSGIDSDCPGVVGMTVYCQ